jgi:hypothetical protein
VDPRWTLGGLGPANFQSFTINWVRLATLGAVLQGRRGVPIPAPQLAVRFGMPTSRTGHVTGSPPPKTVTAAQCVAANRVEAFWTVCRSLNHGIPGPRGWALCKINAAGMRSLRKWFLSLRHKRLVMFLLPDPTPTPTHSHLRVGTGWQRGGQRGGRNAVQGGERERSGTGGNGTEREGTASRASRSPP